MSPSNRQKEYVATRVAAASPLELVRLLYEGALQSVEEAIRALHSGDILGRGQAINKTIEIVAELRLSLRLDVKTEYSNTLAELYGYIQQQLIRAHAEQSESLLQEVSRLLNTLLEGWSGAMAKLTGSGKPADEEQVAHAADPITSSNPYSSESGLRLESRSWQL